MKWIELVPEPSPGSCRRLGSCGSPPSLPYHVVVIIRVCESLHPARPPS